MTKKNVQLPIPQKIDPIRLANATAELSGEIKLTDFPRLVMMVNNPEDKVEFNLNFGKDEAGVRLITGLIKTTLSLECQRCQHFVEITLKLMPKTSPVVSESQIQTLPTEYEPLVTHGELVSLIEVLEEEILLGLPMITSHPLGKCPGKLPDYLK